MEEPEIISPGGKGRHSQSWLQAYMSFLRSSQENRVLKLMPLVAAGLIPLSILDDFLVPVLGVVDDIPTTILVIATLVLTYFRVKRYR